MCCYSFSGMNDMWPTHLWLLIFPKGVVYYYSSECDIMIYLEDELEAFENVI